MKKISLVVAILAIGTAVAFNAKALTSSLIDGCFQQLEVVVNASDETPVDLATLNCADALTTIATDKFVYEAGSAILTSNPCPSEDVVFCCARLEEIQPTDPDYASAPFATINGAPTTKKYRFPALNPIECKVQ